MRRATVGIALSLLMAAASAAQPKVQIEAQDSGVTVRLRGISAVDANIAWASGREGTVLRTLDGGKHWTKVSVPDAKELDFRDIEAFDAKTAVVLSIGPGDASRVYRTEDGGEHWTLALKNTDERAFFDCMVFDGKRGWMLGDPVDGIFQIRTTNDGGRHWTLQQGGPKAIKDEAAFAASGTCIALTRWKDPMVVGGGAAARVHVADHDDSTWTAYETQMMQRVPAAGIFSADVIGPLALLVGGDFEHEAQGSAALLHFGSHGTWVEPLPAPRGYRSGAACFNVRACVAVGPSGVDFLDAPVGTHASWSPVSDTGYDAIDRSGMVAWTSGDKGRIARITFSSSSPPQASPSKSPQATPPSTH